MENNYDSLWEAMQDVDNDELLEGVASVRRNYLDTKKITPEQFEEIKQVDPSPNKKYMDWVAKIAVDNDVSIASLKNLIDGFHEASEKGKIDKADIYQYKTIEELKNAVGRAERKETRSEEKARKKEGYARVAGEAEPAQRKEVDREEEPEEEKEGIQVDHVNKDSVSGESVTLIDSGYFSVQLVYTHKEMVDLYGSSNAWCVAYDDSSFWNEYSQRGDYFYVITVDEDIVVPYDFAVGDPVLLDEWTEDREKNGNEDAYYVLGDSGSDYALEARDGAVVNIWDSSDNTIPDKDVKLLVYLTEVDIASSQPLEILDSLESNTEDDYDENIGGSRVAVEVVLEKFFVVGDYGTSQYSWFVDDTDTPAEEEDESIYMLHTGAYNGVQELAREYVDTLAEDGSFDFYEGPMADVDIDEMIPGLEKLDALVDWWHDWESIYDYLRQSGRLDKYTGELSHEQAEDFAEKLDNAIGDGFDKESTEDKPGKKVLKVDYTDVQILSIVDPSYAHDTAATLEKIIEDWKVNSTEERSYTPVLKALEQSKYTDLDMDQLNELDKTELEELIQDVLDKYHADKSSHIDAPGQQRFDFSESKRILKNMLRDLQS